MHDLHISELGCTVIPKYIPNKPELVPRDATMIDVISEEIQCYSITMRMISR